MPKPAGRDGRPWRRLTQRVRRNHDLCHLCLKPIDKTLPYTDPQSFTVDHLQPISTAPHLALVYTNLAAAHRSCNSKRGNRSVTQAGQDRQSQTW